MSKELEALKNIINTRYYGRPVYDFIDRDDYYIVKKALTPPTEEEMCEMLRFWLGEDIIFIDKSFRIKARQYELTSIMIILYNDNTIGFNVSLPINVVEMTAKYYRGLLNNE